MKNSILDVKDVPKELIVLLKILKMDEECEIRNLLGDKHNKINWEMFLNLTLHHRIYPLIALKLQGFDNSLIPPYVKQKLSWFYKNNIFRMLHLSGEMEQLANFFNTNSIKAIFLKGPFLGNEIYGDVSLRACADLDILIPIEDLNVIHKLLEDKGYIKDDYIKSVLEDWKWRHHHVAYYHKLKNIKVEIHWRLNPGPGREPRFSNLWERKRKSLFTNSPINVLSREDLFLFLNSHGARHGWSRLRWLLDIHRLIEQGMDWKIIHSLEKEYNNFHVVGQGIILSSQLLNTNITKEMKSFIENKYSLSLAQAAIFYLKDMVNLHNDPLPEKISLYHRRHLYSLMSRQQKLLFLLSSLYPYHIDTVTLPLPKNLHFLYFVLRPFLCFWRKTRKQKLSPGEQ